MSHFTTIKTQIRDIDALRLACKELELPLLQNDTARGWNQTTVKGDYVILLKGEYDIALQRQPDGSYSLVADFTMLPPDAGVGPKGGKLLQLYAVHKAMKEARKRGHLVRRAQQQNGAIKLIVAAP
jgi:hypothetical protein